MEPVKISVIQRQLSRVALDSVNRLLVADSAFRYTQADYNKLPPTCQFEKNGKMISFGVLDGSRFNLIQVSDKGVKSLSCYNADSFLRTCYPQVKEFGILKGFVNTVNQLSALTKDLKD